MTYFLVPGSLTNMNDVTYLRRIMGDISWAKNLLSHLMLEAYSSGFYLLLLIYDELQSRCAKSFKSRVKGVIWHLGHLIHEYKYVTPGRAYCAQIHRRKRTFTIRFLFIFSWLIIRRIQALSAHCVHCGPVDPRDGSRISNIIPQCRAIELALFVRTHDRVFHTFDMPCRPHILSLYTLHLLIICTILWSGQKYNMLLHLTLESS